MTQRWLECADVTSTTLPQNDFRALNVQPASLPGNRNGADGRGTPAAIFIGHHSHRRRTAAPPTTQPLAFGRPCHPAIGQPTGGLRPRAGNTFDIHGRAPTPHE